MRRLVVVLGLAACGRLGFDPLGGAGDDGPGPDPLPRIAVIAGGNSTCSIIEGAVACWGANDFGQLADGTKTPKNKPMRVPALDGTTSLSLGSRHACAVRPDGDVWCWGSNDHFQLGDEGGDRLAPDETVPLPARAVQVAVGDYHTCAVLETGDVWCWGKNTAGQLGIGTVVLENKTPVRSLISGVDEVVAGGWATCARKANGQVWCWGENNNGQLGRGTSTQGEGTPTAIAGLTASQITMTGGVVCAVEAGHFRCWGYPYNGQMGLADLGSLDPHSPLPPSALGNLTEISLGAHSVCASTAAGAASCWGTDEYGELGNSDAQFKSSPEPVALATGPMSYLSSGFQHTCGVLGGGKIMCWGRGSLGQLGDGRDLGGTPQPVTGISDAQAIGVGNGFTCASTGTRVRCWGANTGGQLGNGESTPQTTPINTLQSTATFVLSVSEDHSCALSTADKTVTCWGANGYGQLGNGTTDETLVPLAVAGLWDTVSAGNGFTCGLRGGAASCWGGNGYHKLGDNSAPDQRELPGPVPGLSGLQGIMAAGTHACAWDGTGTWCWGNNGDGQLGLGDLNERATPTALTTPAPFTQVTAGYYHTCALDTTNQASCWGHNGQGQLALAVSTQSPMSINFSGSRIVSGGSSTCGIRSDGMAFCWGEDAYGQLGDGMWASTNTPNHPAGLPAVSDIAINDDHACAIAGGLVYCWGNNDLGQLGRGTMTSSNVPVVIAP